MIAPLGRALILISLAAATMGSLAAFAALRASSREMLQWARRLTGVFVASMLAANLLMVHALVNNDFSVGYVAQVGSRALPLWVKIVSLWSSLEGSILFWGAVMALYIAVGLGVTLRRAPEYAAGAAAVWLASAAFFCFLIAGPAQPFHTIFPVPLDGPGPNPLLQNHVLMAIHPPFLYLGYVGLTIPFGLAFAALLEGVVTSRFMSLLRSTILLPWTFLTIAIVLGGWWAYEVLGWGGYWAWDPVENASLLPWLTATAALHSAIVTEKRGMLRGWTMTLVLATYILTILGTFMTRSGVFNSVHSFTQSDIGPTILVFLAVILVASVLLLAARIDRLSADGSIDDARSREGAFFVNNLLFVLLTFTVLIGTVFPLVVEAVQGRQMSVGRPYFDRMAVPVGLALLFLMGVGPALPWGRPRKAQLRKALLQPLIAAAALAAIAAFFGIRSVGTLLTFAAAGYTAHVTLSQLLLAPLRRFRGGGGAREALDAGFMTGRRRTGAYLVHAGVIILFLGVAVSSTMGQAREVQLSAGEEATLGGYTFRLTEVIQRSEPHRDVTAAMIEVRRNGEVVAVMNPRMNIYRTTREPIGTPDVYTRWNHDVYLSVLNIDPAAQSAGLNVMINPMIAWIWGAAGLMALGGFMAWAAGGRRRSVVVAEAETPALPAGALGESQ